jgi:hypothetical protein
MKGGMTSHAKPRSLAKCSHHHALRREAAWRAALERIGEKQSDDALDSSAPKKDVAFRWLGDEVEARRLRQERAHHYVRWAFLAAIGAMIAVMIAEGLTLLH